MVPYEPLEGQMIALQLRMLRAARAMLDPMLNLGQVTRPEAERALLEDVVLSRPMARQELDRYTINSPGQAGSYFYGYSRILQLRAETEVALGRSSTARPSTTSCSTRDCCRRTCWRAPSAKTSSPRKKNRSEVVNSSGAISR
jgi:hypothetical protein